MKQRRILLIEPYYGGSHKSFLQGLQEHIQARFSLLSLPARKWKMRMQLSAPWFADQLRQEDIKNRWFDYVICSTFVDVAVLRALLQLLPGWNKDARFYTYFHENQYAYPEQVSDKRGFQFSTINFTSALLSDKVAFNSDFNRQTFLESCRRYVKKATDMNLDRSYMELVEKSSVIYPGIDFSCIDSTIAEKRKEVPVIVWNHRWEHDKNPEEFFSALYTLQERNVDFRLILLGQAFMSRPDCFRMAHEKLGEKIFHQGYLESDAEYGQMLSYGDIVVSTAFHEFFGISVLEAVRAGCRPLLPNRLSYPELFPAKYLYDKGDFVEKLQYMLENGNRLTVDESSALTQAYSWQSMKNAYDQWIFED